MLQRQLFASRFWLLTTAAVLTLCALPALAGATYEATSHEASCATAVPQDLPPQEDCPAHRQEISKRRLRDCDQGTLTHAGVAPSVPSASAALSPALDSPSDDGQSAPAARRELRHGNPRVALKLQLGQAP